MLIFDVSSIDGEDKCFNQNIEPVSNAAGCVLAAKHRFAPIQLKEADLRMNFMD